MAGALDGVKQIVELANPKTTRRLMQAGMITPKTPIAVATSLPWLLGRGPTLGVILKMNATTVGDKDAIRDRKGSLTWSELDELSNKVARALAAAGVDPGGKVGLLTRNGREMAAVAFAAQKSGVITCPLNTWAKTRELKAVMANVEPDLVVYDTAHADQVKETVAQGVPLVHVGEEKDALEGSTAFEDWIAGCSGASLPPFTLHRGKPKIVIQTSGTTGTPKGASRDASAAGLGALASLLGSVPYKRNDVIVCPAPLFHSFGLATFTFGTAIGATLVLPPKFDAEEVLKLIEEHQATAVSLVPVMIRRIVQLPDDVKRRYDLSSLRIVLASGSAISQDLKKAATDLFGEVLYDLYGSTEAGWVAIATPEDIKKNPKSLGKPTDGIEVAVFSEDGERLGVNETGELYIKSNYMFEGYTSGETKDERDGFMSIGDLGRIDEDGYLYIESRSDDMVIVGGENVYPIEIEDVIESLDKVEEVTVLGVEDDEYGQVLAAFVVGDVSEDDVVSICKEELASYKVPKRIKIVDELPRTSTGKVLKRELVDKIDSAELQGDDEDSD
jgi:acyl-CoA synthetase (AMP-forming)/AMP-acid ligase II